MKLNIAMVALVAFVISSCASMPAPREALVTELPPLNDSHARVYFNSGKYGLITMKFETQVGPVLLDDIEIGTTAKDEYFVVDLMPGTQTVKCTPKTPNKNFSKEVEFTFNAGETTYISCDMKGTGAGFFGALGVIFAKYITETFPKEVSLADMKGTLVAYTQL